MSARTGLTHLLAVVLLVGAVVGTIAHPWARSTLVPNTVLFTGVFGTGWLLASRQPGNLIGWGFLGIASFYATGPAAHSIGDWLRPGSPRSAAWAYWISDASNWLWVMPIWAVLIWIPLHFPDGRLPSPRWRWLGIAALLLVSAGSAAFAVDGGTSVGTTNPVSIDWVVQNPVPVFLPLGMLALSCFVGTIVSLLVRYTRGDAVVRAQLRWMLWAVAIAMVLLSGGWLLPDGSIASQIDQQLVVAGFALIPVAIGVAVLRYRLYEIDRIVSRTAAWALVTVIVVGTYAAVVLAASALLGGGSPVAVALATLAAAAVFLPVLRITRRTIDRLFNRRQYDAERIVTAFGEQLRTADPHIAVDGLVSAVERTLEPAALGIWVRGSS